MNEQIKAKKVLAKKKKINNPQKIQILQGLQAHTTGKTHKNE